MIFKSPGVHNDM